MTEETINALRQTDANLRDAIRMDDAERPQMPADLNERLMQRVAHEQKKPRRVIWPWIAAACVAGVMMIWLTPPKEKMTDVVAENTVVEQPSVNHAIEQLSLSNMVEEPLTAKVETEVQKPTPTPVKTKKAKEKTSIAKRDTAFLTQDTPATQTPVAEVPVTPTADEAHKDLAVTETTMPQEQSVTLTERDIPMTRPENYKYTPEELALMKKQAYQAYLKWAELELEIAKYNLEQTAQK